MSIIISLIAVVSADGFISRDFGVPWRLPADKEHFRAYTAGKWLLLGRTTYEEMLGWFKDGHHPLVMTRDAAYQPDVGQRVASMKEAITLAEAANQGELVVVGGRGAFDAAMPYANRLVITHVREILDRGVPFPEFSAREWRATSREAYAADEKHTLSFEIVVYEKVIQLEEAA